MPASWAGAIGSLRKARARSTVTAPKAEETTVAKAGSGKLPAAMIVLSAATVATFLPAYTLRQFFRHQLRWSRTIRDARRWGYAGLLFTFGLPWALLTLLAAHGAAWAWSLFSLTFAMRLAVGLVASLFVLNDDQFFRYILLLPLRDLIAPLVWAASFMGSRIHWRGDVFDLKNGRLTIAKPSSAD